MHAGPPPEVVRDELNRILSSPEFTGADQLRAFLRFAVETTLAGNPGHLKESVVGTQVFGRPASYDPKLDPVVRMAAMRLREKLNCYYTARVEPPSLRIDLPKGGYIPAFTPVTSTISQQTAISPEPFAAESAVQSASLRDAQRPISHWTRRWIWAMASVIVIAIGVYAFRRVTHKLSSAELLDTQHLTTLNGHVFRPDFSPDGQWITFDWDGPQGKKRDIWIQSVHQFTPRRLTYSAERNTTPAWQPDGSGIAFLRETGSDHRSVMWIRPDGRGERKIGEIQLDKDDSPGLSWSPDGQRLATAERTLGTRTLALILMGQDGSKTLLTNPPGGIVGDTLPAYSPDGLELAFRRTVLPGAEDVYIVKLKDNSLRQVTHDNRGISGSVWLSGGRALLISSKKGGSLGSLWRVPLDGRTPQRLTVAALNVGRIALQADRRRVAFENPVYSINIWELDVRDKSGAHPLISSMSLDSGPQFSPDARWIAFRSTRSGTDEVWVYNRSTQLAQQLTHMGGGLTGSARWSPDNAWLAFQSRMNGKSRVFLVKSSGGAPKMIGRQFGDDILPSWSRDGKSLYVTSNRSGGWEIWRQQISGDARQLTHTGGFNAFESADGAWIFYARRDQSGLWRMRSEGGPEEQILTDLMPRFWGNWALSPEGIYYIRQSRDRDEMIFRDGKTGAEKVIHKLSAPAVLSDSGLAVSPDGRSIMYCQADHDNSNILLSGELPRF